MQTSARQLGRSTRSLQLHLNTSVSKGRRRGISSSPQASKPGFSGPTPKSSPTSASASAAASGSPLRMLFFGKPGAGKGTLSARMTKKYDVTQLSAGDLLRMHIAEGTEVGRAAEAIVASGGLIPDDVMTRVVTTKLDTLRSKNWILDGFPRTVPQGRLLEAHLRSTNTPLTLIVNLDVADDVILNRIGDRWIHLPSGRVYNTSYNPPKIPGLDDITGEPLIQRPDDNPEIFKRRLESFYKSTAPLLSYYASAESPASLKLVTLRGKTSDEMWPQLDAILSNEFRLKPKRSASIHEAMIRGVEDEVKRGSLEAAKL